ncbi:MAG: ChaN family lipoprotein [Deltaproteobacteria bacterium]|nr:ChaN family lipoprotein [Deltaproteobacteria bacterium]
MARTSPQKNPRLELLNIEKAIFEDNQRTIQDAAVVSDKNFKAYQNRYQKAISRYQQAVSVKEALEAIDQADVILFGDYHTLDQSQRSFVRFLRRFFKAQDKKVVVALEAIQHRHQKYLDQFMAGRLLPEQFIKKIGFKEHWFFDLWDNYAIIFDFLKFHNVATYGIEAPGSDKNTLLERDRFMATRIVDLLDKHPEHRVFVSVGDLHLAPEHLPHEIQKLAKAKKKKIKVLSFFQNSPHIYWKLSESELVDHTLLVQLRKDAYCRMHTPPIIVQQSFLNWLYHDEGRFDWIDAKASFLHIVERVAKILELDLPDDYEDVEVYTCGDLGFMHLSDFKKRFSKKEIEFIKSQLLNSQSYFMPEARLVYVANVSIHHAAEEATHYLKMLMAGLEGPRSHKDAFYANILHEAIGFFGSKFINNKRKCARAKDFRAEKTYLENSGRETISHVVYETCVLFLEHERRAKKGQVFHTNKITGISQELFLSITHAIGYDLGDALYYGFLNGKIKLETVQDLFINPFKEDGEPVELYLQLVQKLKGVRRPQRL